ncbi:Macrolide export protein MacA [Caulifigura coniformis]|uniref:Macrolide export protein MacA n=1 Tax=Caulifigura coniformis TaxID=2527983 RepID=A0A517S9G3_9PLAN|nr:efflux RND transporter periplasmic adaptor subunit [Caulifigura coniformis]QDT52771.1 Macrolide export protein MacA [Caulifigura coniformis]
MSALNLRELALDRAAGPASIRRPRRSLLRLLIPIGILLGFAAVTAWSLRDSLLAATPVTVLPVIAIRAEVQAMDTPLFRSAGWIEPRPTPVIVSSLIDGIVEELSVVEGQEVKAGDPVAKLLRADAEIAVRQARAELALQRSGMDSAQAKLKAAETYLKEPIERISMVAAADSEVAKTESMLNRIPAMLQAAEARAEQARNEVESKTKAGQAVASIMVTRAESELAVANANIAELKAQQESLARERAALERRRDTLRRQLELKIEEQRQFSEGLAAVDAAKAQVEQAEAKLAAAELQLSRTVITAPITGKVLSLAARPGTKLMGLAPGALQDASTVVTMYDPAQLQVRADVRLENVSQVLPGQKVQIATPAVSGSVTGRVLAITSLTDIQKNTLQVKIALETPPAVLKPDMLVEAVFLAPPTPTLHVGEPPLRLVIPRSLVDTSSPEPMVWIADRHTGTARRRLVTLGQAVQNDLVEVTAGLSVGDRLIASGRELVKDRQRIQIRGEESASNSATTAKPVTATPSRL